MKNCDYFSQYITEDFNTYIARKRMENCHGNHVEMQALSEMYNRNVEVYVYSTGKEKNTAMIIDSAVTLYSVLY